MEKFIPCRKCKKKADSPIPVGFYRNGAFIVECEHHQKWQLAERAERKFKKSGFNPQFFGLTFSDYVGSKSKNDLLRVEKYVSLFDTDSAAKAKSSFIYMYGPNGCQKTTIANVVGSQLIQKGFSCHYILMRSLIDKLWESQRDEEAKKTVDILSKCDVLIIDEAFSKDKLTLWKSGIQIGCVDEFIRERINNNLGVIFISNTKPNEIESQGFSYSIQDLVIRETAKNKALLTFEDNYLNSCGEIPEQLF